MCIPCAESTLPFNHYKEEYEFYDAISHLWHSFLNNFFFESLHDQIFNPFEINESTRVLTDDADPDIHFFNDPWQGNLFKNSDYYFEDSFNELHSKLNINENSFFILHINIRSIASNLRNCMAYLETLKHEFKIMAMTETWFKDMTIDTYSVNGYQDIYDYRKERSGDGVSLFIKMALNMWREMTFIEVTNMKSSCGRAFIVGVMYRTPDQDINKFAIRMNTILDKLKSEKKVTYLSGDYNINLLNTDKHVLTAEIGK